jgi:soluble lytic murein transglycosylase
MPGSGSMVPVRKRWFWILLAVLICDGVGMYWWLGRRGEKRYDAVILAAARRYSIDSALIKAVVWQESRFKAAARGTAGEIGLMQVRSPAASEWAEAEKLKVFEHETLIDPGTNTLAGAWYLAKLIKRYKGTTDKPLPYALADYNAGRTHVLRWMTGQGRTNSSVFLSQMDYPGTRRYITAVLDRYRHYQR